MSEESFSCSSESPVRRLVTSMNRANATLESEYDGRPICETHSVEMELGSFSPDGSGCDWICWGCIHEEYGK